MFKWKEAVVFDIFEEHCISQDMLTVVIKYAAVPFAELADLCLTSQIYTPE